MKYIIIHEYHDIVPKGYVIKTYAIISILWLHKITGALHKN